MPTYDELAAYILPRKRETRIRGKRHRLRSLWRQVRERSTEARRRIRWAWSILTTGDC